MSDVENVENKVNVDVEKAKLIQEKAVVDVQFANDLRDIDAKLSELGVQRSSLLAKKAQVELEHITALQEINAKLRELGVKVGTGKKRVRNSGDQEEVSGEPKKDRRLKGEVSLRQLVLDCLAANPDGVSREDIVKFAQESGHKTEGKLSTMVYQTLYRLNKKDNVVEIRDGGVDAEGKEIAIYVKIA